MQEFLIEQFPKTEQVLLFFRKFLINITTFWAFFVLLLQPNKLDFPILKTLRHIDV